METECARYIRGIPKSVYVYLYCVLCFTQALPRQSEDHNTMIMVFRLHQVNDVVLLDVVVTHDLAVLHLLTHKDEALLVRWNARKVLNFVLDHLDGVARRHLDGEDVSRGHLNVT